MLSTKNWLDLSEKKTMCPPQRITGKRATVSLNTVLDNERPREEITGEIGKTKFSANPFFNEGFNFYTYNKDGDCKSQVRYDENGLITEILTYNQDGDILLINPSDIKYDYKKEIGSIAKGEDMKTVKSLYTIA